MYNSKEALENLTYCVNGMESKEKYYKIIKQDLDRLEKLEKENKELRKSIKSWNENGGNLLKENTKLKKAIEILKNKTVVIVALKLSKDLNDYNRMTSFENLTQEEYELLKEVLGND